MITKPELNQLTEHLFRHEYGRLVSILTRVFGSEHVELAEDVVQDALVEAISHWSYEGLPDSPQAWLFLVAKNKALNIVNREKYKKKYALDAMRRLQNEWDPEPAMDYSFSQEEILDDQLRMIFTCCHSSISPDSQVALALKTLCGFSIAEIAKAFLTSEENINKRLVRARQSIRENRIPFEVPGGLELERRLKAVLETIYLLFNEGYSASQGNEIIRHDLCAEAIRLAEIIAQHGSIHHKSDVYGLLALMQLNASRFNARQDTEGNLLTLAEQDRSQWDQELIARGISNLRRSIDGEHVSRYQLLATISAHHAAARDFESTDWNAILSIYDNLAQIDSSPIVLLNRAIALAKVKGPEQALGELDALNGNSLLKDYHLFYSTRAEFHMQLRQFSNALTCLQEAAVLSTQEAEKRLLRKKIAFCTAKLE